MTSDVAAGPPRSAADVLRSTLLSGRMLYVAFVALIVIFAIASPVFLTTENFANVGRQTALVSIMAVGMTLVIISGEFDLSVGSVMALAGVAAALAMQGLGDVWIVGAVVAIATGAAVGLVNGLLTTLLSIPSFLITLGSLSIARGLALLVTGTRPINIVDESYYRIFGEGYVLGVPVPIVWTIVVALAGIVLLHFSTFGRKIYATGGNATAARYTGINTRRVKTICLVIAGTLAGLAALVLTARSHAARPDAGAGIELDVIAAVILGGAALSGGRGTVIGALIGSLMIGILNNGLNLVGVDPSLQLAVKGLIIWFAVALGKR
ncbi:MAG: ABC transporter permease [Bauldia sp.]|nr:ABC transporter permease [Bauldia sp.]